MLKKILSIIFIFASTFLVADESKVAISKEKVNAINQFINSFFNEDEIELNKITEGALKVDLQKYFWIKKAINNEMKVETPKKIKWKGTIEIISIQKEKVFENSFGESMEYLEDVIKLKINEKSFTIILHDNLKVIGFNNN